DDPPRRPRPRAKRGGNVAVILALLGLGLLGLLVAGVVVIVVVVKYARVPAPPDVVKPAPGGGDRAAEVADRPVGSWEGESPARPSVKVYLEVTRDRITLKAQNVQVNVWADPVLLEWRVVRAAGDTLVIQRTAVGSEQRFDWSVVFRSADAMSITPVGDD